MDEPGRRFVNRYQGGFPLCARPWERVAAELRCGAATLLESVRRLLDDGTLSRFGPLYDASAMGGGLTLAAMSVPAERFAAVAARVNERPEVAHNYERDHPLNMWFVIATETPARVAQVIAGIERDTGLPVLDLPRRQTFYLGLWLIVDADGKVSTRPVAGPLKQGGLVVDDTDRAIIAATQAGLPLVAAPYDAVAADCGCGAATVIERLARMQERGVIRRIGAVPNHYRLGLGGNGMTVWDVDDERLAELGARVGRLDFVSHCYERPRRPPRWPYNLFAMVHACDRAGVLDRLPAIEALLGRACRRRDVLFSKRILKKTGLRLVA